MTPTKIIVKNGYGRPENPFPPNGHELWADFESTVKSLPVVGEVEDGVYMARLKWCKKVDEKWVVINNNRYKDDVIGQAYRILLPDEKPHVKTLWSKDEVEQVVKAVLERTAGRAKINYIDSETMDGIVDAEIDRQSILETEYKDLIN